MSLIEKIHDETNLGGVLVTALEAADGDASTFTARFFDTKTGVQRTPQTGTSTLFLNKDSKNAERIRTTGTYSTDSDGITTVTVATNGRNLPMFGTGAGTTSGNRHDPSAPIGAVTNHEGVEQINDYLDGDVASGANALRTGAEDSADIYHYFQDGSATPPFLALISNVLTFSNDGVSSTVIGNGASVYTGGDGIDITASVVSVDLTDATKFSTTAAANRAVVTLGTGKIGSGLITAAGLATYISDVTVTADQINTAVNAYATALVAGEAIDGSSTPQALATFMKGYDTVWTNGSEAFGNADVGAGTIGDQFNAAKVKWGDLAASSRLSQSFTYTNAKAATIKINKIIMPISKTGTPSDNIFVEVMGDDTNKPDSVVITNGTSDTVAGSGITNAGVTYNYVEFTFSTNPEVISGVKIHVTLDRSGSDNASDYYNNYRSDSDTYASHGRNYYDSSIPQWGAETTTDLHMYVELEIDGEFKIFKLDANDDDAVNFYGFTEDNVAADAAINVSRFGVQDSLSGLTKGKPVFGSTSAGITTQTVPTSDTYIQIGDASDTTDVAHQGQPVIKKSKTSNFFGSSAVIDVGFAATGSNATFFFKTGFTPSTVDVRLNFNDITAVIDYLYREKNTPLSTEIFNWDGSDPTITAISAYAFDSFDSNGFFLTFKGEEDADTVVAPSTVTLSKLTSNNS